MNLGQAIKLCRTKKRLTQAELAVRCSLSESYLSLIESGRRDPTFSTVETISKGLEVPASMLVFLAADSAELAALTPEVREKMSSAIISLLQASADDPQSALI